MPQSPANKLPLDQSLYQTLLRKIVDGELKAREQLPAERILSEEYGVHRGVVREALKRLEAQNLVETRRGGGTRILDFRQEGGLDLLGVLAINNDGLPNLSVIKDITEWREDLGVTMTRRATLRDSKQLAQCLDSIVQTMREADINDISMLQELSLSYWDEIAKASNNLAYSLALNSFKKAYAPFRVAMQPLLKDAFQNTQSYQDLADVIRSGDGDKAAIQARSLVAIGGENVLANIEGYLNQV